MFKKLTAKAFGVANIGRFVSLENLEEMYGYSFTLDHVEQVYYAVKTKEHEYFFTNRAIIHVDKRAEDGFNRLKRYDYSQFIIKNIFLETAGDLDIECTLQLQLIAVEDIYGQSKKVEYPALKHMTPAQMAKRGGMVNLDIDVHVDDIVFLRAVYKTFIAIKLAQSKNIENLQLLEHSFQQSLNAALAGIEGQSVVEVTDSLERWYIEKQKQYSNEDFADIFETSFAPVL